MFSLASTLAFHYLCRMKTELKENGGLPAHILWTLAIVAGISVANLYYNQPLLNVIRHELGVSEFRAGLAMKEALKETLPHYMVPKKIMFHSSLPMTGNGKVDRRALAASSR